MRTDDGGYRAILAERPIRRLLLASLSGRVAFTMLPLGFVFFATAQTGSTATAGAVVAAFALASALAPARGRIVDRHGPRALVAFATACAGGVLTLALAGAVGAPSATIVLLGGVAGLVAPPIGPFTRAVWGAGLRDSEERLQRIYALDSAFEEAALIVSPLLVALVVSLVSPAAALVVAAAGLLAGTIAAARSTLAGGLVRVAAVARTKPPRLPAALWLLVAAIVPTAMALGAIDIAVPAAARAQGSLPTAGLLLAAMAVGTVAGSLLAGRSRAAAALERRVIALIALMSAGLAGAAAGAMHLALLGVVLVLPGLALGALFATLYVLVDQLAPEGSGTRTFAWLVTANNGGLALGAAIAGTLTERSGPAWGLWFAAVCALTALAPASAAAVMSARVPERAPI